MAGLVRPDDLMLVNRAGTDFQTEVKNIRRQPISDHKPLPGSPWEGAAGIYHVILTDPAAIMVTGQSNIYNLDTKTEVSSIDAAGEWIITGNNTKFKDSTGTWDFGALTDTSNVTNMSGMFEDANVFNSDISNWDTANVRNMDYVFMNAHAFNQNISNWDTANVTSMTYMFDSAGVFNSDISNWDVGNVTLMRGMFENAVIFNSDISNWEVGSVTNMNNMFGNAQAFNSDISKWNVGNVENMRGMFEDAWAFNSDISNWDVSNVTDMYYMFCEAHAFNSELKWDVGNVANMKGTFCDAEVFNQDLSGWCVTEIKYAPSSFRTRSAMPSDGSYDPKWGTCPDRPTEPVDFVPLPDGVTLNLPKDMVVNKHSRGAGIIPHDPWITIDIRTSINTDDYLFCMCWPHFSGQGGDGISGPNSDRDMARLGYTIDYRGNKAYTGCLYSYRAEYDGINTTWHPLEVFSKPFGFSWDIGNHLSFVPTIKKLDVAKCQPYIIAYPKTHLHITTHKQAIELNGGEFSAGETANVPEGSYFIYMYADAQQHWIVKDGLWQFGKSFKDARFNEWTDEKHTQMLDLAPMMVDITDWNFARVEK